MAQPAAAPIASLSDSNMSQVAYQIGNVEKFDGNPHSLYTFVSRIDYILALYTTNDVRQQHILFGHVERCVSGEVMRTLGMSNITSWAELRRQLILNYKTQTPNHILLEEFRSTPYKGNVRSFLEEAERRRQVIISKLELENDVHEKLLYSKLIKTSIEGLIQKLPINIYIRIVNHEIQDLRSLINILQEKNMYENINHAQKTIQKHDTSEKQYKPFTHNPNLSNHNAPKYITPFQPFHNPPVAYPNPQPYYNQLNYQPYRPPIHNYAPQLNPSTRYTPRPNLQRQNVFDQNRFGHNQNPIQRQPHNADTMPNSQPNKRPRQLDSGQSRMSIDELRNQEVAYHEQYNPYDNYYDPTYYNTEYHQQQYEEPYEDYSYTQLITPSTGDENGEGKELTIEEVENFQPPASKTNNL